MKAPEVGFGFVIGSKPRLAHVLLLDDKLAVGSAT